jgi:tyrosyl-tRNA synthetase
MSQRELTPEEKCKLIIRDLQEVVGEKGTYTWPTEFPELLELLKEKGTVKIYWGTATTGKPHFGYFVPMYKIADFLAAGCEVTILFADIHAYLDNMKSDWDLLKVRCEWYSFIIQEMLKLIGVPLDKLKFVRGSDFQLSREYTLDVYRISALVTTEQTTKAGADVVKQVKNPLMSSLLYPILQALDEQWLGVDAQFGGIDQRKIFMFAREHLPSIGYKKRLHLMNPLIPGLGKSGKMSSSEPLSKIDFDDSDEQIKMKIEGAYSVDGQAEGNGLLAILKYVIFRRLEAQGRNFVVERDAKWGGKIEFKTYAEVERAFTTTGPGSLSSLDLKRALIPEVIKLIAPLRNAIQQKKDLFERAYPPNVKPEHRQEVAPTTEATIASLDLRVGKVIDVSKHPRSDEDLVLKVDVGEKTPRTVVASIAKYMSRDTLLGNFVVVVHNLAKKTVKGIESEGMILMANGEDGDNVKLLQVPSDTPIGEKLTFDSLEGTPDPVLVPKRLNRVLANLKANEHGVVEWRKGNMVVTLRTSKGPVTSVLKNSSIG